MRDNRGWNEVAQEIRAAERVEQRDGQFRLQRHFGHERQALDRGLNQRIEYGNNTGEHERGRNAE